MVVWIDRYLSFYILLCIFFIVLSEKREMFIGLHYFGVKVILGPGLVLG